MRIVSGKYRSKKLAVPDGMTTRPTSDRARESVFNVLDSRLRKEGRAWNELIVADIFAGTGALGVEALSRGARALFAAEKDAAAVTCFRQNTVAFIKDGQAVTLFADALNPPPAKQAVDLLFMDPPYAKGLVAPALTALVERGWINADTVCVVEIAHGEKDVLPDSFEIENVKVYGKAEVLFVRLKA